MQNIETMVMDAILLERRRVLRTLLDLGIEFEEELLESITGLNKKQIMEIKKEPEF